MTTPTTATGQSVALGRADAARQSLATGTAGTALLHLERACITGTWTTARTCLRQLTDGPIDGGDHTGLYYGIPALAFVLHCAASADPRYTRTAASLDEYLLRLARHRLAAATTRIRHGETASFAEYDLFYGITGLTALLIQRAPDSNELADLLGYLVRLTEPHRRHGILLPGWWVTHHPDPLLPTPGGHANLGMAHGAAGILAALAIAKRRGHIVDHHTDAINRLTDWFDRWRQHHPDLGTWWPQWLTLYDLTTGHPTQTAPGRPSWCYGTPGIARALHLAALATHNHHRRADAEQLLATCLDQSQTQRLTEPGLCHGLAGLYQTAFRAAADATNPTIAQRLPALAATLHTAASHNTGPGAGLLTGHTGVHLAAHTTCHGTPHTGWDTCLLIV